MTNGFSLPEIEQAFISCLMQWPKDILPLLNTFQLTPEHFQTPQNRILFSTAQTFIDKNNGFDLIAFTNELRELGLLDSIGGPYYVTHTCCNTSFSPSAASYYAQLITEAHAKLLVAASCGEILEEVQEPMQEPQNLIESAIKRFNAIPCAPENPTTLRDTLAKMLERKLAGLEAADIIKTGLLELDRLSPFRRADMPLIVGQRKAGKTVLALSIALNLARQGIPVLYFSVEDKEPKLLERLLAQLSRVPLSTPYPGTLFEETIQALGSLPIQIKDDLYSLAAITAYAKTQKDIGCIIVDYAQKVSVPSQKGVSREQEVAEVSRALRLLAMELNTPLIVLSQLNKDNQARESLALEQDCTACWWLQAPDDDDDPNTRIIAVPYQRNGPGGIKFKVTFLGQIARIENFHP